MVHQPLRLAAAALLAGLATLAVTPARAHEGHGKASPSPTPSLGSSGSPAADEEGASAEDSPVPEAAEVSPEPVPGDAPEEGLNPLSPFPWKHVFQEHLHNKLVHFPFAFGIAAALFLLAGTKWPAYEPAAKVLLWGAALFAIGAFFTGQTQQDAFLDGALDQALKIHRLLGIGTAISLWVGVVLTSRAGLRRSWPFYALWLLGIITATATFGGILSHGSF